MNADTPPCDLGAERATLGAMLLSKDAIADAIDVLGSGAHFYSPHHEAIFDAIVALDDKGEPADLTTVAAALTRSEQIGKVGGPVYLAELVEQVPTATNARYYAEIVLDKAIARRHAAAGNKITYLAMSQTLTADELTDQSSALVDAAAGSTRTSPPMSETFEELMDSLERGEDDSGLRTGLLDLDLTLNRLQPGQFGIVAARPGVGKTVMLLDIARSIAYHQQARVLFVSLEMSRLELQMRVLSSEAKINLHRLVRRQKLDDAEYDRIGKVQHLLMGESLRIEFVPGATLADVRSLVRRHRPDVVFVDYLQLMTAPKAERRELAVSELSRGLKLLAQREGLPVWVASQLNRGPAQRQDRMPQLTDLRESGSLEQDADVVLLLHREDSYERESSRPGEADIIIAKQRNGVSNCHITVAAQMHFARFVSMSMG